MATRERASARGGRMAAHDLGRIGSELRMARVGAGLSLRAVGAAVGLSKTHVARIERAEVPNIGVRHLVRLGAVLGLDVRIHAYPGGDPLRDAGHIRLAARLRERLHPDIRSRSEHLLPGVRDARAWDMWLDRWPSGRDRTGLAVELETRVTDYQALLRRLHRKMRDGGVSEAILVVADTSPNRHAIRAAGMQVAADFPASARMTLAHLADGERPHGSALVFI